MIEGTRARIEVVIDVIERVERFLLAAGILTITFLMIGNVVSRIAFHRSLAFAEELSQFSIITITFVGLSYGAGQGRHIRMTALYDQFSERNRRRLMIFTTTFTALLMLMLAWFGLTYVRTVAELGTSSPVLQVPLWIIYSIAPIGFLMAGAQYVLAAIRNWRSDDVYLSWTRKDEYDAVPTGEI